MPEGADRPLRPAVGEPVNGESGPTGPAAPAEPVTSVSYRVDPRFTALKIFGVVIFALIAVAFGGDPVRTAFAGAAALVVAGYALRDLIAPVRLTADRSGVTLVAGYAGHRRIDWPDIERVRLDRHSRFGVRSEYVEIDTGETLHLLSSYDLGARPYAVVEALLALQDSAT
jgi:hypothetical protein